MRFFNILFLLMLSMTQVWGLSMSPDFSEEEELVVNAKASVRI